MEEFIDVCCKSDLTNYIAFIVRLTVVGGNERIFGVFLLDILK